MKVWIALLVFTSLAITLAFPSWWTFAVLVCIIWQGWDILNEEKKRKEKAHGAE